jgi:hypothetical protein
MSDLELEIQAFLSSRALRDFARIGGRNDGQLAVGIRFGVWHGFSVT